MWLALCFGHDKFNCNFWLCWSDLMLVYWGFRLFLYLTWCCNQFYLENGFSWCMKRELVKKCGIYLCLLDGWYVSMVPFSASRTVVLSNQVLAQFDFNFLVNGDMREQITRKASIVRVTISRKDYHQCSARAMFHIENVAWAFID